MFITYQKDDKLFSIDTGNTTYQMDITPDGHLRHLYYGKSLCGEFASKLIYDYNLSQTSHVLNENGYRYFSELVCQEYSSYGIGDYGTSCIKLCYADGSSACDLIYESHSINKGKKKLSGLPATYFDDNEVETLEITLKDAYKDLRVCLSFSVAESFDAIIRSARIINNTDEVIRLDSALSLCLDFDDSDYDFITFGGRALSEREFSRSKLSNEKLSINSNCGRSSHSANPFVIVCAENTNEIMGECYGASLLYSGNFIASLERNVAKKARLSMGINPDSFSWQLNSGEEFQTPEAVLCYSNEGFGKMSQQFHKLYREHLCRGYHKNRRRPVLINSWEAFVFDFDSDKLVSLAEESAKLGIELLVLDDGWFGERSDDDCSLGDWYPNEKKLKGSLAQLSKRINDTGLKFGLWIEPEMISKKSNFYIEHPEWLMANPDRKPAICRNQFVLDLSRKDVEDYLFDVFSKILKSANIEYIKWDMNRPLTDVYSFVLPTERQGEVSHRYMLGVYSLLERLTQSFPNVLFESCASGGGRFDAGMLYYSPQIWCSDNSEPSDRAYIQYNTSFGYPMSAISAHVSPSPNLQTGRESSIKTRGIVALTGSFGYELDIRELNECEKALIKEQIAFYKNNYDIFVNGDYFRLSNPYKDNVIQWQFLSEDKNKALVGVLWQRYKSNSAPFCIKLLGLEADAEYSVRSDCLMPFVFPEENDNKGYKKFISNLSNLNKVKGSVLMNVGLRFSYYKEDSVSFMIEINKIRRNKDDKRIS